MAIAFAFTSCKKNTELVKSQETNNAQAAQQPVTAAPLTAKFTVTVDNPTSIYENQSIQLNNQSTGAAGYSWDFGNDVKSTDKQPTISYPMHGYYTVTLTVWDAKGNTQKYTQDISILCLFANGIHTTQGANG